MLEDYPDMIGEGWTLVKVEEFANKYGLNLVVKDTKGNSISEYGNYLDAVVIEQNRTGKIASGVSFTVKINVDMSSYKLIINYNALNGGPTPKTTEEIIKKNGDTGTFDCPGIENYEKVGTTSHSYTIDGKNVIIDCNYNHVESSSLEDEVSE